MTQLQAMYGGKKNASHFCALCFRAGVYLDKKQREKGKHTLRAIEVIYDGFAFNTSAWSLYILELKEARTTNQATFAEHEFPFRKKRMVEQYLSDN